MATKTCGECKNLTNRKTIGVCEKMKYALCPAELPSCANFQQKIITNGDKIRQMSNEELAAGFAIIAICGNCVAERPDCGRGNNVGACKRAWLAHLNAPAESEGEDE